MTSSLRTVVNKHGNRGKLVGIKQSEITVLNEQINA